MALGFTAGWLPYGSDDGSVVAQHSLKSAPSAADLGYSSRSVTQGSGPQFDSSLGMLAWDGALGSTYQFSSPGSGIQSLNQGGQLTLKVQSDWCSQSFGNSTGANLSTDQVLIAFRNASGSLYANRFRRGATATGAFTADAGGTNTMRSIFMEHQYSGVVSNAYGMNHVRPAGGYSEINIGWSGGAYGGRMFAALDGLLIFYGARTGAGWAGNLFDLLWIGYQGSANAAYVTGHYIKEFQLSTSVPVFKVSPKIGKIGWLGDSLIDLKTTSGYPYIGSTAGDASLAATVERILNQNGIRHAGPSLGSENSGGTVYNHGANWLGNFRSSVLGSDTVIIGFGANDAVQAGYAAGLCATGYLDHCEYFSGVGSYTSQTKKARNIIICTTPARRDKDYQAEITSQNAQIKTVPAQFFAAYPSLVGKVTVTVVDVYEAIGGASANSALFDDTVHWNDLAWPMVGRAIAKEILRIA